MNINVKKVNQLKWNSETENVKQNNGMLMFSKGRTTWQEIIKLQAAMVIHSCFVVCSPKNYMKYLTL